MIQSNKRALTWSLIVIGVIILAVGGVMLATFPWQQGGFPFAHMWAQGQGVPQGAAPDGPQAQGSPQGWYGYHGWFMHGPRLFGGGLLILVLLIIAVSFFVRRSWYWGSWRHDGPDRGLNAEEILRRKFALGEISEEEYKSRLSALRK